MECRDQYKCVYCSTKSPLVEAGGVFHCANLTCHGPGAAWFRSTLKSFKDAGRHHTVDHDEWASAAQAYVAANPDKGYVTVKLKD